MTPETDGAPAPPGEIPKAPRRGVGWSFGLGHLMGLVAAVALASGVAPACRALIKGRDLLWLDNRAEWLLLAFAQLTFWTLLLAARLAAGGRRRLRRATRTYGGVATLAAAAAIGFQMIRALAGTAVGQMRRGEWSDRSWREVSVGLIFDPRGSWHSPLAWQFVCLGVGTIAVAVVAAWAILALSGRGRRLSGWLDLMGLLLGAGWTACALASDFIVFALFS